jgi:nitrate reductase cytochrome c-type subunit
MSALNLEPRVPPSEDEERLYSKKFDKKVDKFVKRKINDIDQNRDYLDTDPEIYDQRYFCVSFTTPQTDLLTDIEATKFEEYLLTLTDEDLQELKDDPSLVHEEYQNYKKNYRVHLDNVIKDKYPGARVERALKVRGSYRSSEEAVERAKELAKKDQTFHIFVGEVGKWMPYDPQPLQVENYETTEKQLNNIVAAHKQEQQRAKEAYEIRKYGLLKDAERKNKRLREENKKYLENNELLQQFENELSKEAETKLKLESKILTEEEHQEYLRETAEIKYREENKEKELDRELDLDL